MDNYLDSFYYSSSFCYIEIIWALYLQTFSVFLKVLHLEFDLRFPSSNYHIEIIGNHMFL